MGGWAYSHDVAEQFKCIIP